MGGMGREMGGRVKREGIYVPFPILNQTIVPCQVLTVTPWPAYRSKKFMSQHKKRWDCVLSVQRCSTIILKAHPWHSNLSIFWKTVDTQADSQAHSDLLNENLWGCNSDTVLRNPKGFFAHFSLGVKATASCTLHPLNLTEGWPITHCGILKHFQKIWSKNSFVSQICLNLLINHLLPSTMVFFKVC